MREGMCLMGIDSNSIDSTIDIVNIVLVASMSL